MRRVFEREENDMSGIEARSSLNAVSSWVGSAAAGSKRKPFKYVAEGTTLATGCIKTKEGDLKEHNVEVRRHGELAMSTRR